MPHFPLPYAGTPGGIDGADVQHQPGDVSFVIDQVLADASSEDTVFAGLVDDEKIGSPATPICCRWVDFQRQT